MRFAYLVSHRNYVARDLFVVFNVCLLLCASVAKRQPLIFQNQWAVHIPSGQDAADEVASTHGFTNLGQVKFSLFTTLFHQVIENRHTSS